MDLPVEQYYLSQEVRQANRNIVDPFVDYTELFVREVLKVADATVDFSPYDYVIIHTDPNLPLEYARLAWAGSAREGKGYVTSDKTFYDINAWSAEMLRPNHEYVGVHEILHLYGLPDYYSNIEGVWRGDEFLGSFDLMSNAMGKNKELLLWSRWFIGWVTNDDVECLDARRPFDSSQHVLNATMGEEGVKGVMLRLSEFELLLIERKDYNPYCLSCQGGLLVTIQDTSKPSMWGSLRIVRPDFSSDVNFEDAFLTLGSVLETNRLRIEVIQENDVQTMIQITQLGN
jgi:M6 family metalloprotease-like protein